MDSFSVSTIPLFFLPFLSNATAMQWLKKVYYQTMECFCPLDFKQEERNLRRNYDRLRRDARIQDMTRGRIEEDIKTHLTKGRRELATLEAEQMQSHDVQRLQLAHLAKVNIDMSTNVRAMGHAKDMHDTVARNNNLMARLHGTGEPTEILNELGEFQEGVESTQRLVHTTQGIFKDMQDLRPGGETAPLILQRLGKEVGIEIPDPIEEPIQHKKKNPEEKDLEQRLARLQAE
jgi:hypothetical protein